MSLIYFSWFIVEKYFSLVYVRAALACQMFHTGKNMN